MVIGRFTMDAFTIPSSAAGEVVLVAIEDEDLMAMMALMLEMAGYRVVPVETLRDTCERADDVHPRAVVADLRGGNVDDWNVVQRLQNGASTGGARLVVVTEQPDSVPAEIQRRGAVVVTWPFPVTDLLRILAAP